MALTGNAAVEAVQAMMFAANQDARFNGPKVVEAIKAGRARLVIAGIRLGRGVPLRGSLARFRAAGRSSRAVRRVRGLTGPPDGSSSRPRSSWVYVGSPDGPPFKNGWGNA